MSKQGYCETTMENIKAAEPKMGSIFDQAKAAGVPFLTILQWIMQYGPQIFSMITDLINKFKTTTTVPPTTPPA